MLNVITIIVSKMTSHCAGTVQQRCADCGRVRLRTQIRSTSWIRGLTADGFFRGRCGRGLTRITSHSFSAPRWILWASLMKLVLRGAFRGGQCLITVAYNCLDTDTRTPTCRAMQGAGGEWYGHGNIDAATHSRYRAAAAHPATLQRLNGSHWNVSFSSYGT